MHWKDVVRIKELLLMSSINEVVALVKTKPTDIEAHANLADAYITLSKIYVDPRKMDYSSDLNWTSPEYQSKEILSKFHLACDRAIEELKILSEYSPNDPWVHRQLADIYHNRDLRELEIKEYEQLLKMENSDKTILFRLGVLYFGEGSQLKWAEDI
jgi:tetratricopeptide (TPR) repeat protein